MTDPQAMSETVEGLKERLLGIATTIGLVWGPEYRQQVFDTANEARDRIAELEAQLGECQAAHETGARAIAENARLEAQLAEREGLVITNGAVNRENLRLGAEVDRLSGQLTTAREEGKREGLEEAAVYVHDYLEALPTIKHGLRKLPESIRSLAAKEKADT